MGSGFDLKKKSVFTGVYKKLKTNKLKQNIRWCTSCLGPPDSTGATSSSARVPTKTSSFTGEQFLKS